MNTYTILYNIERPGFSGLFGREFTVDAETPVQAVITLYQSTEDMIHEIEDVMVMDSEGQPQSCMGEAEHDHN